MRRAIVAFLVLLLMLSTLEDAEGWLFGKNRRRRRYEGQGLVPKRYKREAVDGRKKINLDEEPEGLHCQ